MFKKIIASAFILLFATGANAECLRYGDVINIRSGTNQKFLVGERDGVARMNRSEAKQWEKFLVLNSADLSSESDVYYGDKVVLRDYLNNEYLASLPDGTVNADGNSVGLGTKWEISFLGGNIPNNTCVDWKTISTGRYALINLKSDYGKFLKSNANDDAVAIDAAVSTGGGGFNGPQAEYLRITPTPWYSFYYNKPYPKHASDGNCTHRGRYDGANCLVGSVPGVSPAISQKDFYYSGSCVMGNPDGNGRCKAGNNPTSSFAFIYDNAFYLRDEKAPPPSMNCPDSSINARGSRYLGPSHAQFYDEVWGEVQICSNAKGRLRVGVFTYLDPSWTLPYQPLSIRVCAKRKWTFQDKCHIEYTFTQTTPGVSIENISGLDSGKRYFVRVYITIPGKEYPYMQGSYEGALGSKRIQ